VITSVNRLVADEEGLKCLLCHEPPCSKACPVASDPGAFLRAVRLRDTAGAACLMRADNPLAAVCAVLCQQERYCERACVRNKLGSPVNIRVVHQYIAEQETPCVYLAAAWQPTAAVWVDSPEAVAVCASLQRAGHAVTAVSERPLAEWFPVEARAYAEKDVADLAARGLTVAAPQDFDPSGFALRLVPAGSAPPDWEGAAVFDYARFADVKPVQRLRRLADAVRRLLSEGGGV
jgi:hypothetical protein